MPPINLLIVESPAKCKKIQEFLGSGWRVKATMGHIRALKEELAGIGFRTTWTPTYESIDTKADAISALRREVDAGAQVFLGSDDDREGEAIAWHVCALLGLNPATTPRVVFHEITASAITTAVENPTRIDINKFHAQQARTMLDLLIGFTLSPCLWRCIGNKPGLSAGRCQTPALRIIYERDQAIANHTASLSWRLAATTPTQLLATAAPAAVAAEPLVWRAVSDCTDEAHARSTLGHVASTPSVRIRDRKERISVSSAPEPFITSTLQQEASSRLGMNPKVTMKAAQNLYEAGHITYMRTDNAILSEEAKEAVHGLIRERWGEEYVADASAATVTKKKVTRKKKAAAIAETAAPAPQAAHEGIRPTHMDMEELSDMSGNEQRLYELIWRRTVQSQMSSERRQVVKLIGEFVGDEEDEEDADEETKLPLLETEWDCQEFAGWRALVADEEEAAAVSMEEHAIAQARTGLIPGEVLAWSSVTASEVRTSPPSRFTEASLIRELEKMGIGRPSTYASLVDTVLTRGYVEKATIAPTPVTLRSLALSPPTPGAVAAEPRLTTRTERMGGERDKLRTTALGRTVIEWLLGQFPDLVTYELTAEMETALDEIAKGRRMWQSLLTETWERYADRYDAIMGKPTGGSSGGSGRVAEFGDGYKMVISKKGPLFVLESSTGEKTRFASVPAHLSLATATRADAEAAFASSSGGSGGGGAAGGAGTGGGTDGESLGELEGAPVVRKSGRFGPYVVWKSFSVNCKATDGLAEVKERLLAKADPSAVDRVVGEFRIRKGPYGLYMFKIVPPGSAKKPVFVGIPDDTPWASLSPESAALVYETANKVKKAAASGAAKKAAKEDDGAAATAAAPKKRAPRKKKE